MKKIAALLLFFSFLSIPCFSQDKFDYVWLFGAYEENGNPGFGINVMDFNNDTVTFDLELFEAKFYVTDASISNSSGSLIASTNGCVIYDSSFSEMENGDSINPGLSHDNICPHFGYGSSKGALFLPSPNNENEFYLFHTANTFGIASPYSVYIDKLYYSIIETISSSIEGVVTIKNQVILEDTLYSGHLSAVKHENNIDWWVVIPKQNENKYFKVLLEPEGDIILSNQKIGENPDPWGNGSGQACFSPDGTKYALYNNRDLVYLFDFDRSTGELSNFRHLLPDTTDYIGGVAFSSNSRYLYVSTLTKLWQYDVEAPDIEASKILIAEYDGYKESGIYQVSFWSLQLAPDCKIYMIAPNGARHLHVINYPNMPGLACGFEQRGVPLPAWNLASQPNFPMYRLGTPYPICDSSIVMVTSYIPPPPQKQVLVFPNPASDEITISVSQPTQTQGIFSLYDLAGGLVRRWSLERGEKEHSFEVAALPSGLYFWQWSEEGKWRTQGKIVVAH